MNKERILQDAIETAIRLQREKMQLIVGISVIGGFALLELIALLLLVL